MSSRSVGLVMTGTSFGNLTARQRDLVSDEAEHVAALGGTRAGAGCLRQQA
jgi:hypothetical protein